MFDTGVSDYVKAEATVQVAFPVDMRGVAYISCSNCWLYRKSSNLCVLTGQPIAFPDRYVGSDCPLHPAGEPENK